MLARRPTGSEALGATPKRRLGNPLSLALNAVRSQQQTLLDIQEIQGWYQRGELVGGLWLPDALYNGSPVLYEASALTVPSVTGAVVGSWLDISQGLGLGPELNPDPGFDNAPSWSVNGTTSIADGVCNLAGSANQGAWRDLTTAVLLKSEIYQVETVVQSFSSGGLRTYLYGTAGLLRSAAGTYSEYIYPIAGATAYIQLLATATGSAAVVDKISVKRLNGCHAVQTTTGNKPTLAVTPQTRISWLNADSTDVLPVVFSGALGSACTIARAESTGVTFAEAQTVSATWNGLISNGAYNSAVLVAHRALTGYEKAVVSRALGRYVPIVTQAGAIV